MSCVISSVIVRHWQESPYASRPGFSLVQIITFFWASWDWGDQEQTWISWAEGAAPKCHTYLLSDLRPVASPQWEPRSSRPSAVHLLVKWVNYLVARKQPAPVFFFGSSRGCWEESSIPASSAGVWEKRIVIFWMTWSQEVTKFWITVGKSEAD